MHSSEYCFVQEYSNLQKLWSGSLKWCVPFSWLCGRQGVLAHRSVKTSSVLLNDLPSPKSPWLSPGTAGASPLSALLHEPDMHRMILWSPAGISVNPPIFFGPPAAFSPRNFTMTSANQIMSLLKSGVKVIHSHEQSLLSPGISFGKPWSRI